MSDLTAKRPRATPGTARLFVESRGALPQGPLRRHAGRYNKMGRGRPRLEEQRRPPKPPGDVKSKAIRAAETAKRLAALFAELQEAKRIDRNLHSCHRGAGAGEGEKRGATARYFRSPRAGGAQRGAATFENAGAGGNRPRVRAAVFRFTWRRHRRATALDRRCRTYR